MPEVDTLTLFSSPLKKTNRYELLLEDLKH